MSDLSNARIKAVADIPDTLTAGNFSLIGIKKYKAYSQLVKDKIAE